MASTSETGHAKNVANFEELITNVTGFGTVYNPPKESIKLPMKMVIRMKNGFSTV